MRILALSDVHDCFEAFPVGRLPDADVCLIAGDLTNYGVRSRPNSYSGDFVLALAKLGLRPRSGVWESDEVARAADWLLELSARYPIYWIAGNHDFGIVNETFDSIPRCVGIMGKTVEFMGWRIHGVNMSPCYDAPILAEVWTAMTIDPEEEARAFEFESVDVVVSHSPPFAHCDSTGPAIGGGERHVGSSCLLNYAQIHSPRLILCGHIHEGRGASAITTPTGTTMVHNVACVYRLIEI